MELMVVCCRQPSSRKVEEGRLVSEWVSNKAKLISKQQAEKITELHKLWSEKMLFLYAVTNKKCNNSVLRLSVCYQTCKHDISNVNKQILMPTGTSGPRGKNIKR